MGELNEYHVREINGKLAELGTMIKTTVIKMPGAPEDAKRVRLRQGLYITVRCWGETATNPEHFSVELLAVDEDEGTSAMFEINGILYEDILAQIDAVSSKAEVAAQSAIIFGKIRVEEVG